MASYSQRWLRRKYLVVKDVITREYRSMVLTNKLRRQKQGKPGFRAHFPFFPFLQCPLTHLQPTVNPSLDLHTNSVQPPHSPHLNLQIFTISFTPQPSSKNSSFQRRHKPHINLGKSARAVQQTKILNMFQMSVN